MFTTGFLPAREPGSDIRDRDGNVRSWRDAFGLNQGIPGIGLAHLGLLSGQVTI